MTGSMLQKQLDKLSITRPESWSTQICLSKTQTKVKSMDVNRRNWIKHQGDKLMFCVKNYETDEEEEEN